MRILVCKLLPTLAVVFITMSSAVQGDDIFWNNPLGGNFSSGSNWLGGAAPGLSDAAIFDLTTGGYTVTSSQNESVSQFFVRNDVVTLNFGAHTLNIVGDPAHRLRIADSAGDISTLRITSGTVSTSGLGVAAVGGSPSTTGVLELDGPEARLEIVGANNENQIGGGEGDAGELRVINGAQFVTGNDTLNLGRNGGSGFLSVSGESSVADVSTLYVGLLGHGNLSVSDGGLVRVRSFFSIANQGPSPTGDVTIGAGGRILGEFTTTIGRGGRGSMTVDAGGEFRLSGGPLLVGGSNSQLTLVGDGLLDIDGGIVESEGQIQVGAGPGSGSVSIHNGGVLRTSSVGSSTGTSAIIGFRTADSLGSIDVLGAGAEWINGGMVVAGWEGSGTLRIEDGGIVESARGQLGRFSSAQGAVNIADAGSRWTVAEDLTVGGTEAAQGGQGLLDVGSGGKVVVGQTLRSWQTGTIDVTDGGIIEVGAVTAIAGAGSVLIGPSGILSGNGTILGDVVNDGGAVSPGASPGALKITGNYSQLPGSLLSMEIGGTAPGTEYDQLLVTGNLDLQGLVEVSFINGFLPQVGDTFNLFSAGGVLTPPTTLSFLNAPAGFDYTAAVQNGQYSISVTAVPEPASIVLGVSVLGLFRCSRRERTARR